MRNDGNTFGTAFGDYPLVYLITQGNLTPENFSSKSKETLEIIEFAAKKNISLIQIREKQLPACLILQLACEAVNLAKKTKAKILINDRVDIAIAARADGVHLTSSSVTATVIRQYFNKNLIVGASTHSHENTIKMREEGADFVTFGPIFKTSSKVKYGAPQGLGRLKEVCEDLDPFPVIALGGIAENNYRSTLKSGARGFAAIRFLNDLENLEEFG